MQAPPHKHPIRRSRLLWALLSILVVAFVGAAAMWPSLHLVSSLPTGATVNDEALGAGAPAIQARSAVVMDRATGTVLYKKNANEHLPMGSTTKIMTALLVLEHEPNLDVVVTVPAEAVGQRGALIGLHQGDRITIRNLLLGSLLKSATDCSVTLAHRVGGSQAGFVVMMNARAAALGLTNTHYANASGIRIPNHYTSALDLATLSRQAMKSSRFRAFVDGWRATVRWQPYDQSLLVESHNWLVRYYDWGTGIKTGSTSEALACMAASGKYNLRSLIITTLREPDRSQERIDVIKLFKWADALYVKKALIHKTDVVTQIEIPGTAVKLDLLASRTLTAVVRRAATITVKLAVPAAVTLPVSAGDVIGTATYSADGQKLGTINLLSALTVPPLPSPSTSPTNTLSPSPSPSL